MKKKMKDLTMAEIQRICDNTRGCSNCPLFCIEENILCILIEVPIRISYTYWESEVEIPEEVFGNPEQVEEK